MRANCGQLGLEVFVPIPDNLRETFISIRLNVVSPNIECAITVFRCVTRSSHGNLPAEIT